MHRALLISEVICQVCQLLSTDEETAALAALARTARALHEPAIDALWCILGCEGMCNLVRCMPPDLWEYSSTRLLFRANIRFVRDIVPSDWDRALFYAKHVCEVRSFSLPLEMRDRFVDALSTQRPGITLFPNLRHIHYKSDHGLPLTATLIRVSGLKCMQIGLTTEGIPSISKFIANARPPLEKLELAIYQNLFNFSRRPKESPAIFFDMLETLHGTKSIRLCLPLTWFPGAIVRLSSLPYLEKLDIEIKHSTLTIDNDSVKSIVPFDSPPSPFPSLCHLGLYNYAQTPSSLSVVTHSFPRPRYTIRSLRLMINDGRLEDDGQSYIRSVCDAVDPTGTSELSIEGQPYDYSGNPWDIAGSLVQPLRVFTNLEVLSMRCTRLDVDDSLLKKIADEWPNLKHLYLVSSGPYFQEGDIVSIVYQYITVDGLSYLASSCPSLIALTCHIDLRDTQSFLEIHDGGRDTSNYRNNQLQELNFASDNTYGDATHAADVLSTLFPRLRTVTVSVPCPSHQSQKTCAKVETLLREKARSRADNGEPRRQSDI